MKDRAKTNEQLIAELRALRQRIAAVETLKQHSQRLEEMVEERTKELREAQEQLIRKERLAVLGKLAGGLGHELRNPLGAIKNALHYLDMVMEKPAPQVQEALAIMKKEVTTSERIISGLLEFARPKPPSRQEVDVNDLVREALSRTATPENVEMVTLLAPLPTISADPTQLGQVFTNIILNAFQATPKGGRLLVKSRRAGPKWVAISFADTGIGIPKEDLPKVFQPLFTTKARGTGLGLAVCKTIVEGHGGSIEVESNVDKGSTFTVRLPIGEREAAQMER